MSRPKGRAVLPEMLLLPVALRRPAREFRHDGKNMKLLRGTLFVSIAFLPLVATGVAQPAGKPVLSAQPVPTQPAPAPTPVQGTPMISPNYVIGPDDVLLVTVWNEGQLSGSMPVRPDGMITLPLIGDVLAAGSTPMQLKADLTTQIGRASC